MQRGFAGLDVKGTKAYVLRSLLPPKCRAIVKGPDVQTSFFMLVLALIDFSPSKKIPAGELGTSVVQTVLHTPVCCALATVPDMAMAPLLLRCTL